MRVVGFGTYDVTRHPRIGVLLDGLREHGHTVVEINRPLGFSTAERVAMMAKPWKAYRFALRLVACWAKLTVATMRARRLGRADAVVVGYLGHFDVVLARALFPRTRVVLDQMIFAADTAQDRGVRSSVKIRLLRLLDAVAVRCADLVVVDTPEHLELMPSRQRDRAVVVPVGSQRTWFEAGAARRPPRPDAPLRVVFYGLFTPLQGATVIGEALQQLADRDDILVTLIGTGQDEQATSRLARDNPYVTWRSWVDSAQLPALVAGHDVCLGIFGTSPKARRVVPNKVYQGAAAGCAVVTSDTPPQRRALGEDAVYVPPGDSRALTKALEELAGDRTRVVDLQRAAARRSLAQFTPSAAVANLVSRLKPS